MKKPKVTEHDLINLTKPSKAKLSNDWFDYDMWYLRKIDELRRAVWNCKGVFSGHVPPYPLDVMAEKMLKREIEKNIQRENMLMGVPERS